MTPAPLIETARLRLRDWSEGDRDLFHEINADRKVMEYFPFRRTRAESDALFDRLRTTILEDGLGFHAVALKNNDEAMGFCGLARAGVEPVLPAGTVEIGWRLATRFWGHGYITEAAGALLDHGFATLQLPEIVSFAVAANRRSVAVMERIGLRRDTARDFDHPRVPDDRPDLKRHVLYAIGRDEWKKRQSRRS